MKHRVNQVMYSPISVVIPLYNKGAYISRAVASVLKQTVFPGEVIIVDDGSTDDGVRIAKSLDTTVVRVISQVNQGPGVARNTGLNNAVGDWVALLDADDIWLPNHLEEITKLIEAFPRAGLVSTRYDKAVSKDVSHVEIDIAARPLRKIDYFFESVRDRGIVSSSTCALQSSAAKRLGGFGGYRYGEDIAFWTRIAMDYEIAVSSRVTAVYARNTGGLTELDRAEDDIALSSISEVCPALEVIESQCRVRSWGHYPSNIRKFVDFWLFVHLKNSIHKRDLNRAHSIAMLMSWRVGSRPLLWRSIAMLPNVLSTIMRVRDTLRRKA